MEQTTLGDRLRQAHGAKVEWILQALSRDELEAAYADADGDLWGFGTVIALEAARRHFAGEK